MNLKISIKKALGTFHLEVDCFLDRERVGVFGESGSGKTTFVNLLAGLLAPDSGAIFLDGQCLFSGEKGIDIPPERRRIGVVFQHPHLFPHLSVKGNLLFGYKRCAPENRKVDFPALVDVLRLGDLLKRGIANLSGGEKQRVALGRAVLSNPRLLLLDEPLSGLDDNLKFQIIPYLKAVSDQFSIPFLFISHSMMEMRLMTEWVLVMEQGALREQTTAEDLARRKIGHSRMGYLNLLKMKKPDRNGEWFFYSWGGGTISLPLKEGSEEAIFELSSKDILIMKRSPDSTGRGNILKSRVVGMFPAGNEIGLEIDCAGEHLIAEVSKDTAAELEICRGAEIFAVIKPSALRPLF